MKILFLLMRVRLLALFSGLAMGRKKRANGQRSKAGLILFAFLLIYMLAAISGLMVLFAIEIGATALAEPTLRWFYFAFFGVMAFGMMTISGMFIAKGQLYDPKDNDLLLSMPLRPGQILASRMMLLYLSDLFFELPILLPAGIVSLGYVRATFSGVLFFLLAVVLLPLLAVALSCLLGFVLAWVTARVRKKTLFQTIIATAFFGLYMYGCMNLSNAITAVAENIGRVSRGLRYALPFLWMGRGIGEGAWGAFGLFALVCVAPACLCVWLLSLSFVSITTEGKHDNKVVYDRAKDAGRSRTSPPLGAFVKKEVAHLFGSFTYLFNAGLGIIMMILAAVLVAVKAGDILTAVEETGFGEIARGGFFSALAVMAAFALSSMTLISAPSVSIEGKQIWVALTMPVRGAVALRAKTLAHFAVAGGPTVLFVLSACIALRCPVVECVTAVPSALLFVLLTALTGTLFNVLWPKLDWLDEAIAVKQSGAVMVTMGVIFLAALLFGGATIVLSIFLSGALANLLVSILLAGLCAGLWMVEEGPAGRAFERLGNR